MIPEWASDSLITNVDVTVSFRDRLRVLLLGKFSMRVVAHTEGVIGRTEGESTFYPPRFRPRRDGGYAVLETPAESVTPGAEG